MKFVMLKKPPTSFSLITSTNIGISSQKFLTFNFNLSATLVLNFKAIPGASPKLLNLNEPKTPLKEVVFSDQMLLKLWL